MLNLPVSKTKFSQLLKNVIFPKVKICDVITINPLSESNKQLLVNKLFIFRSHFIEPKSIINKALSGGLHEHLIVHDNITSGDGRN